MENLITPSNITFALGIIGLIFTVWNKVRDPQTDLDKRTAVEREEVEGKASLLAQQLQWEKEANVAKFNDMTKRLDDAFALAQNHIHTVDEKLTGYIATSNAWHLEVSNKLTELGTIISERIPKK